MKFKAEEARKKSGVLRGTAQESENEHLGSQKRMKRYGAHRNLKFPGDILFSDLQASDELLCLFKEMSATQQSVTAGMKS